MKLPSDVIIELSIEEVNSAIEKFLFCRGVDVKVNKVRDVGYPVTHFDIHVDFRQADQTSEKIDMYIDSQGRASKFATAPENSVVGFSSLPPQKLSTNLKDIVCPPEPTLYKPNETIRKD